MPEIGVRELKARASQVLRDLRERRARYVITHRGRPVAVLLPLEGAVQVEPQVDAQEVWERLTRLGEEIGRGWRSPRSSAELLSEMRR